MSIRKTLPHKFHKERQCPVCEYKFLPVKEEELCVTCGNDPKSRDTLKTSYLMEDIKPSVLKNRIDGLESKMDAILDTLATMTSKKKRTYTKKCERCDVSVAVDHPAKKPICDVCKEDK